MNTRLLFVICCFFLGSTITVSGQIKTEYPSPIGFINDFEEIFSDNEEKVLDFLIRNFEVRTTIEIGVVTIKSSMTDKENFNRYILDLSNHWGIGKKDKNNGILIAVSASLRSVRISNGAGILTKLSDEETKSIIDSVMIPEYRLQHYFEGTKKGIYALINQLQ